jgi:hypothetical protein
MSLKYLLIFRFALKSSVRKLTWLSTSKPTQLNLATIRLVVLYLEYYSQLAVPCLVVGVLYHLGYCS